MMFLILKTKLLVLNSTFDTSNGSRGGMPYFLSPETSPYIVFRVIVLETVGLKIKVPMPTFHAFKSYDGFYVEMNCTDKLS